MLYEHDVYTVKLNQFAKYPSKGHLVQNHKRGSSVNFGGQDIFARKCTYEKLIKCAAKITLCIFLNR